MKVEIGRKGLIRRYYAALTNKPGAQTKRFKSPWKLMAYLRNVRENTRASGEPFELVRKPN